MSDEIQLKKEDLEAVAVLFDCIREVYKELDPDGDKKLAN